MEITNKLCIGLMSGTSLDGLDIVAASFRPVNNQIQYTLEKAENQEFPLHLKTKLTNATKASGWELTQLDHELADFFANSILKFITKNNLQKKDIMLIASHGHTVFHQPNKGITLQIGHPARIAAQTNIKVIANFRAEDVVRGGQGAPLVPIGDQYLFSEYDACINLGGFCNISFENNGQRKAFDIAPCNLPLNRIANLWGQEYDPEGIIASEGIVNTAILNKLNELAFYKQQPPKSLGTEWLDAIFYPVIDTSYQKELMATVATHIATQIAHVINANNFQKVLCTGGGTYNNFLLKTIQKQTNASIMIPDQQIIDYKEALIFALMGWLKHHNKVNVLNSVTGGSKDGSYGISYQP